MSQTMVHKGKEVEYEDVTPTPLGYANLLQFIIKNTVSPRDREWARKELRRIEPAVRRGSWK